MPTIPQFPAFPGITFPVTKTLTVATSRGQAKNGRRFAQPSWPYPLYSFEIDISLLRSASAYQEFQTFEGFWKRVMTTPGQLFIWVNHDDGTAVDQLIGTGDGTRTLWQAMRTLGGFVEPVTAVLQNDEAVTSIEDAGLVADSVTQTFDDGTVPSAVTQIVDYGGLTLTHFFVNGAEVDVTIFAGGALRFTDPPPLGSAITWSGIYGWLCQPDEDTAELEEFMSGLYSVSKFTFTTARPNA